jgi:regulator of sirC expression with transglutaminase-like and TPR domain
MIAVTVSLHLQPRASQVAAELEQAMNTPGEDLGPAALAIAKVEYPSLEAAPYLDLLDRMGEEASARIGGSGQSPFEDAVRAFNEYFYDEQGFSGNRERYDDPRNSFLNEVLNRRTGIPISLAVVYLEVARRAGLRVAGVNFPGHFLLRAPLTPARATLGTAGTHDEVLIVDPFHKGAFLSEIDCRELLRQHVGDAAAFDRTLLEPATRHQIVVRMLVNLKRLYVRMRSFPQARFISGLLRPSGTSARPRLAISYAGAPAMLRPPNVMRPRVGRINPAMVLSVVVLPAPLLPRMVTISPCSTVKEMPRTTSSSP